MNYRRWPFFWIITTILDNYLKGLSLMNYLREPCCSVMRTLWTTWELGRRQGRLFSTVLLMLLWVLDVRPIGSVRLRTQTPSNLWGTQ